MSKQRLIDIQPLMANGWHLERTGPGNRLIASVSLADIPVVDPVVHGRWEDKPTGRYGKWQSWCSACGEHSGIGGIESNRHRKYCPNCGAKMDLED